MLVIPIQFSNSKHSFAISPHDPREFFQNLPPQINQRAQATLREGAGNTGRPMRPQPVCIGSKHTVVTTVTPKNARHSPRNGFNGFLRALPGDEFVLSPSPAD
jgi:hypothetical protein